METLPRVEVALVEAVVEAVVGTLEAEEVEVVVRIAVTLEAVVALEEAEKVVEVEEGVVEEAVVESLFGSCRNWME